MRKALPALISFFVVVIFLLPPASAQDRPREPRAPDQYGRFVITFSPHARADTFLLDTQTGKVWELIRYTDLEGEPRVWRAVDRLDSEAQELQWLRQQPTKSRPKHPAKPGTQ